MNKFKYNEAMNLLMEIKEHPGSDQRIELCKKKLAEQEKQVAAVLRSLLVVVILVVAIITGVQL